MVFSKLKSVESVVILQVEKEGWYPPGHGDLYQSFYNSELIDRLIEEGKEYVFVSNVDNLGATVDVSILYQLMKEGIDFAMELTDKTPSDVKGGTLIRYRVQHLFVLSQSEVLWANS